MSAVQNQHWLYYADPDPDGSLGSLLVAICRDFSQRLVLIYSLSCMRAIPDLFCASVTATASAPFHCQGSSV
jgi:hypothetical protein